MALAIKSEPYIRGTGNTFSPKLERRYLKGHRGSSKHLHPFSKMVIAFPNFRSHNFFLFWMPFWLSWTRIRNPYSQYWSVSREGKSIQIHMNSDPVQDPKYYNIAWTVIITRVLWTGSADRGQAGGRAGAWEDGGNRSHSQRWRPHRYSGNFLKLLVNCTSLFVMKIGKGKVVWWSKLKC